MCFKINNTIGEIIQFEKKNQITISKQKKSLDEREEDFYHHRRNPIVPIFRNSIHAPSCHSIQPTSS